MEAVAPGILLNVVPFVLISHCTGRPRGGPAAAEKVAICPATTLVLAGCAVTCGISGAVTVSVTDAVFAELPYVL